MFDFTTKMDEVLITLGNWKNEKAFAIDGVSVEVLKTSILVIIFLLMDNPNLSLSRQWFPNCLRDSKAHLLNNSVDILNISDYWSISILSAISKKSEKIMHEQFFFVFRYKTICFVPRRLVFVVNEVSSTLLLKMQEY